MESSDFAWIVGVCYVDHKLIILKVIGDWDLGWRGGIRLTDSLTELLLNGTTIRAILICS